MTVTLTMPELVALVAASMLWGVVIGGALMLDVLRPATLPPVRVPAPGTVPFGPLAPFPGDGIVTHNELDQFARHYQGLTR